MTAGRPISLASREMKYMIGYYQQLGLGSLLEWLAHPPAGHGLIPRAHLHIQRGMTLKYTSQLIKGAGSSFRSISITRWTIAGLLSLTVISMRTLS